MYILTCYWRIWAGTRRRGGSSPVLDGAGRAIGTPERADRMAEKDQGLHWKGPGDRPVPEKGRRLSGWHICLL